MQMKDYITKYEHRLSLRYLLIISMSRVLFK